MLRTPQRIRRFACLQDCLLTLTWHLARYVQYPQRSTSGGRSDSHLLLARHHTGAADITEWGREVTLCGVKLGEKKGGPFRTEQTGVYPLKTAFTSFMKGLKEEMATVKDLGGGKPTPVQRDETVTKYHVQYIIDNPFPPPSDGVGERERLLT